MDFQGFIQWCKAQDLNTNTSIASALSISTQTVRNWKSAQSVPFWVRYATLSVSENLSPMPLTVSALKDWQNRNKLFTYESTAAAFQLKRQAVHQWFHRGSLPKWLSLACPGYELKDQLIGSDKVVIEQSKSGVQA